jgi:hypothetical protein
MSEAGYKTGRKHGIHMYRGGLSDLGDCLKILLMGFFPGILPAMIIENIYSMYDFYFRLF